MSGVCPLALLYWVILHALLQSGFSVFKKFFPGMSISMDPDPDQAPGFVRPDLGTNCL